MAMVFDIRPINAGFDFVEHPRAVKIGAIDNAAVIVLDDGMWARGAGGLEVESERFTGRELIGGVDGMTPINRGNMLRLFSRDCDVVRPSFCELVRVIQLRFLTKPKVFLPKTGNR